VLRTWRQTQLTQWALLVVPALVLAVLAWQHRWMSDDGFIHLRVVQQVLAGNGPVFNVGERVEASTSPLWVGLLVVASIVPGISLPMTAVVLGIALTCLGVVVGQRAGVVLARSRRGGDDGLFVPLGAAIVVALPPFWDFATSGLEMGLVWAWIGLSSWWCARRATTSSAPGIRVELLGAALVGLGALIRPDLAVFTVAFAGVVFAAAWRTSRRRRLGMALALVALPLGYQVFRMGYYAMLVPNTALAKEAGRAQWEQGWTYLLDFVGPYVLWVPIAAVVGLLVRAVRRDLRDGARLRAAAALAPALAGVLHAVYVLRAGGDFMHGRLLLPGLFGLVGSAGVWVPAASLRLPRLRPSVASVSSLSWTRAAMALTLSVTAVWAAVCLVGLRRGDVGFDPWHDTEDRPRRWLIAEERRFYTQAWKQQHPIRPDLTFAADPKAKPAKGTVTLTAPDDDQRLQAPLRKGAPRPSAQAVVLAGMVSYAWGPDVFVVDKLSLANPIGSHVDQTAARRPGHQKPVPLPYLVADVTDLPSLDQKIGPETAKAREVAAARRVLTCGRLDDYLDGIREPLTPGRFARNVLGSAANTMFRIDRDPVAAASSCAD
jgi:arabinofuranosyltransferase